MGVLTTILDSINEGILPEHAIGNIDSDPDSPAGSLLRRAFNSLQYTGEPGQLITWLLQHAPVIEDDEVVIPPEPGEYFESSKLFGDSEVGAYTRKIFSRFNYTDGNWDQSVFEETYAWSSHFVDGILQYLSYTYRSRSQGTTSNDRGSEDIRRSESEFYLIGGPCNVSFMTFYVQEDRDIRDRFGNEFHGISERAFYQGDVQWSMRSWTPYFTTGFAIMRLPLISSLPRSSYVSPWNPCHVSPQPVLIPIVIYEKVKPRYEGWLVYFNVGEDKLFTLLSSASSRTSALDLLSVLELHSIPSGVFKNTPFPQTVETQLFGTHGVPPWYLYPN